ncbi:hypothetical protein PG997_001771 [Apiospora hydei]|uniref:Uncharacterized protein n=1 Tax=Apiospora hydei TaxID=1337664 RepID=A0ABR1XEM1_9PEZI
MASVDPPPPYAEFPPATSGDFFDKFPGNVTMYFRFHADPTKSREEQPWIGIMRVKAANVPQLMKEGFSVAEGNVLHEQGYIAESECTTSPQWMDQYSWSRHIFLRDRQQEPARWAAHLIVRARGVLPDLGEFRFLALTHRNVALCRAVNNEDKLIYRFEWGQGVSTPSTATFRWKDCGRGLDEPEEREDFTTYDACSLQ